MPRNHDDLKNALGKVFNALQKDIKSGELQEFAEKVSPTLKKFAKPYLPQRVLTIGKVTISYTIFPNGKEEEIKQQLTAMLSANPDTDVAKFADALGISIIAIDRPNQADSKQTSSRREGLLGSDKQ